METEGIELARIFAGKNHAPLVYFIRIGDRVKIGTTTNLSQRVADLSLTLAEVAKVVPGGMEVERAFHDRFDVFRVHSNREWFYVRGSLTKFLKGSAAPPPLPSIRTFRSPSENEAIGLSHACHTVISGVSLASVRAARKRDPEFPKHIEMRGQELLYDPVDLIQWAHNRPKAMAP